MASFWSKLLGSAEAQDDLHTRSLYQVPGGVHYYDYAALQAAKLGIFVQSYSHYHRSGTFIKWESAGTAAYACSVSDKDKEFLTKASSMQDLYRVNVEKLRDQVAGPKSYQNFIDFLRVYLRGQEIAERELAEAEHLRTEAQRAQALVGAYRLSLHDSPLMAELACTQDIHLLRQVTERLKLLEEDQVKALPAVKLLLSSPTPVQELHTAGIPSLR